MARRKPTGTDVPADDEAAPLTEPALEDATRDDDEPPVALPWLQGSEEDEPAARRPVWALPAAAGALLVMLLGIYLWNTDTAGTSDEPPVAEEVATTNVPSTEATALPTATQAGPVIQLASFYSPRRAERYWPMVQHQASGLANLQHSVVEGSVNGRTVYRLRAAGPGAFEICDKLRAKNIECLRIGH